MPESDLHISLDASSNGWKNNLPGIGGYNHASHQYFSVTPPEHLRDLSIADLELLAHIVAFHLWCSEWENAQVMVHTDNAACFYLLTNGRSRDDLRLRMSRWLCMQQVEKGFRTVSSWIPTTENNLADALSRPADPAQQQKFNQYCTELGHAPTSCHVRPEFFEFDF